MEGFTIVDGIVGLVILISAVLAYSRGFVRETMAILGWIAAAVAAFYLAAQAEPLLAEIPVLADFLGDSCELSILVAFVAVFAVALIAISLFAPFFAGAVQRSALGGIDQGLGFLFGAARGVLLVIVALIVYDRVAIGEPIEQIDDSRSVEILGTVQDRIAESIPSEVPEWIVARYGELMGDCGLPEAGAVSTELPPEEAETPTE